MTFAAFQAETTQRVWEIAAGAAVAILALLGIIFFLLRRFFQSTQESHHADVTMAPPRTENPSAFMTASMQQVIRQLRGSGKGAREAPQNRKRARGKHGTIERRSDAEHAGGAGGGECYWNYLPARIPLQSRCWGFRPWDFDGTARSWEKSRSSLSLVGECLTKGKHIPEENKSNTKRREENRGAAGRDDFSDTARDGKN